MWGGIFALSLRQSWQTGLLGGVLQAVPTFLLGPWSRRAVGWWRSEVTSAHSVEIISFSWKQELLWLCWGSGAVLWDCYQAALPVLARFLSAPWPTHLCMHPGKALLHPHDTVQRGTAAPKGISELFCQSFPGKRKPLGKPGGLRGCWGGRAVAEGAGRTQGRYGGSLLGGFLLS